MPRQNTSPADYPRAVLLMIEQLAQNIVIARKRRGETQAQWAKKLGVSQPTMARIERGDPAVAMASYVMCMWLINPAESLADLIAPLKDHAALEREVSKVRKPGKQAPTPALPLVQAKPAAIDAEPGEVVNLPPLRPAPLRYPTAIPNAARLVAEPLAALKKYPAPPSGIGNATAAGLADLLLKAQPKAK
ncbi:helix-turn-helix transcriptional regulator [Roseateles koreensis]|uniref:XRE family transcriptional regulator n=1 Tax=Roseateles koreensis TaxID=2987526 RepID=A0ABT5KR18_9BURK|nr:XRE family transcriptional regulator [Roseateles koreensis]MDC8785349.1 XRE family transcriptional regulator [Roseateles koreensis]